MSQIEKSGTIVHEKFEANSELDSHADTVCAGKNFIVVEYTNQACDVHGFSKDIGSLQNIPIAKVATAWIDPANGEVFILIFNHALYFGNKLDHSLICPNQLRAHGVIVDDVPKQFHRSSTHSIYAPEDNITIPLEMHGCISYFSSRSPTKQELENCPWIILTSPTEWNPYSMTFANDEKKAELALDETDLTQRVIYEVNKVEGSEDVSCNHSPNDYDKYVMVRNIDAIKMHERRVNALGSGKRNFPVTKEELMRKWKIGYKTAEMTLKNTTQKVIRNAIHPISRRYRTKQQALRYNQLGGRHGIFYMDTMFATVKSTRGNTMGTIFCNSADFTRFYPMKSRSETPKTLKNLIQDIGIPAQLHSDDAKEFKAGATKAICEEFTIKQTLTEPYSQFQNRAENKIFQLKKRSTRRMNECLSPARLWDYCTMYESEIMSLTASMLYQTDGRTGMEIITGNTPDISEYVEYDWYEPVWYYEQLDFPAGGRLLGRWLGVSHRVGQAMCSWILQENGIVIARSTTQRVTADEKCTTSFQNRLKVFDEKANNALRVKANDKLLISLLEKNPDYHETSFHQDEDGSDLESYEPIEKDAIMLDADEFPGDTFDEYIQAEVLLPKGGEYITATVSKRKRAADGKLIGKRHSNPLLDTRIYEVQFPDGHSADYAANLIAEALYTQTDEFGNQYLLLSEIIDHKKSNDAVKTEDMWISGKSNKHKRKTTRGWKLLVTWKDGSETWERLADLKRSNPIEVAEYAIANLIDHEPAFSWWVHETLKIRKRIIEKINSRYHKRTHKYGIRLPKTIDEALAIDKETGTDFWRKAIQKEMKNVMPAFKILDDDDKIPIGYTQIPCHMIFDIKIDFTRKARFVAGGHKTEPPSSITYSSVVSRDSVRIALLLAALNDVDILAGDIQNAYLNAQCREKVWTTAGREFGPENIGKKVLIVRALYGLRSSGAAFRSHLADSLHDMGFKPSLGDPDVWMSPSCKPDGTKYYEYILVYVDDLLIISHEAKRRMQGICDMYKVKPESIGVPTTYLGAQVKQFRFEDSEDPDKPVWAMSSEKYVKEAIRNVELELDKCDEKLATRITTPLASGYRPELDMSPLCDDLKTNYYQNLIGVLRWAVELGRIDIHCPVALLSQYLAQPRLGHLDQALHIFAYLKQHQRSTIVFDDRYIEWEKLIEFPNHDWTDFYRDAKETIPTNMPEPRGKPVQINVYCDANHAGNKVTRRSHSGILIYCNRAPILWYSKRQNTVETSTFGSESIALRITVEMVDALRYKLRMMGVPLEGPATILCDNLSLVTSTTIPESVLQKKHNSVNWHKIRETIAMNVARVVHIDGTENISDVLSKLVPGTTLRYLLKNVLY